MYKLFTIGLFRFDLLPDLKDPCYFSSTRPPFTDIVTEDYTGFPRCPTYRDEVMPPGLRVGDRLILGSQMTRRRTSLL